MPTVDVKKENVALQAEAGKDIWICEDCGREYSPELPFPDGCVCGNWSEDWFRLKDIYDFGYDERNEPLFGVTYAPEVLALREKELNKRYFPQKKKSKKEKVITQSAKNDKPVKIEYKEMKKKALIKYLDKKGYEVDPDTTKKELVRACKQLDKYGELR